MVWKPERDNVGSYEISNFSKSGCCFTKASISSKAVESCALNLSLIHIYFGEILAENRKKKGYSQSDLVDLLSQEGIQVTTKAISKWETNAREPALHVFLTLCQLLDIEDIYESFFGENPYNIMSGLNEEGRNKLIEFADILKASKKFSPLSAKIIPFHHPVEITWEPVSAGTGNYLEDSVKETYDVGHLAPEQTDFGVRISGDSMEPLYHTDDVAWIQKKDSLANGEIGIFYLNGNT